MLNFGASKPRVKGGPPLDPHLCLIPKSLIRCINTVPDAKPLKTHIACPYGAESLQAHED